MSTDLARAIAARFRAPEAAAVGGSGLSGLAGTALLHARLSPLDPAFARAAAVHWEHALRTSPRTGSSIHQPAGGVAASLILGTPCLPDPCAHADVVGRAVRWLSAQATSTAEEGAGRPHSWDAINGLAATGRVLLAAAASGHAAAEPGLRAALTSVTAVLLDTRDAPRPGWWTAPEHHLRPATAPGSGSADTGLAHGVAGPLALLTAAVRARREVPRQTQAIERAADWLVRWRTPEGDWPPQITGEALDTGRHRPLRGRRDAWCYGTPGITNALRAAADTMERPAWAKAAADALAAFAAKPAWDVEGPDVCHGHAGVLLAVPAASAAFERAYAALVADTVPSAPGLLTGAVGVALALAARSPSPQGEPWRACLLLA
ncbi:lanthionine synthetase LanC family protein [Actinocorallia sp. A-T 12471]|uniref:lanthionine synthetase LanC family protein n=1 Tax=Actinocorallia sp. A-T 12471 TaxID=3089813 RepID=UPI0029D194B5|nr:lanthionine synthetase LanC family protein [Actinocorallia sp. A-T 12471]MDX6738368.1 lanthionine synthetase LanC family protein [Actinocorallia sp. A-T 12471]